MKKEIFFSFLVLYYEKVAAQLTSLQHPKKGIPPFNAPCKPCAGEVERRTVSTHEFFALKGDGSKSIDMQKSPGNMNDKDKDGFRRTNDSHLVAETEYRYAASALPSPVEIDFEKSCLFIRSRVLQYPVL